MKIDYNNKDITFYFSFQCPYSYMSWVILQQVLKKQDIKIAPIEIGNEPTGSTKYHFRETWGKERWARIIEDAARLNIRISQPEKYVSSFYASRGMSAYTGKDLVDYITSIFRAVFLARVDISMTTSLRMHLQSEGIDSAKFATAIEDPSTEKLAKENLLLWGHNRIRTIPAIEYEKERLSGLINKRGVESFLRAIIK